MNQRKKSKYVHEGHYVAEVEVTLVEDDTGWSPYLSVADAYTLDDVRDALRRGDLQSAAKYGRIHELRPVTGQSGHNNPIPPAPTSGTADGRRSVRKTI